VWTKLLYSHSEHLNIFPLVLLFNFTYIRIIDMWILRKYGKKWIDPVSKKAWLWATYICMQKYLTYMGTFCIIQKRESRHLYTATRHIYIYIQWY